MVSLARAQRMIFFIHFIIKYTISLVHSVQTSDVTYSGSTSMYYKAEENYYVVYILQRYFCDALSIVSKFKAFRNVY